MTRAFIESLLPKDINGLKSIIDDIMKAHGTGIETQKAKTEAETEKVTKLTSQVKELESAVATANDDTEHTAEIEKLTKDIDKLKADLEAQKTESGEKLKAAEEKLEQLTNDHASEKRNTLMDAAVKKALVEAGMPETGAAAYLRAGYDRETLKDGDDGAFEGMDKLIESTKADDVFGSFFGEMQENNANVGDPPDRQEGGMTIDKVKKMTPEEINANWDSVQKVL